ncbi:MAG: hypothetical protein NT004_13135 [Bacteroidetes bacterium]|nr:hypothetical protein [Bacteroidota bacterium]
MSIIDTAEEYLLANLSVIPVSKDKRATIKWEQYQRIPIEINECSRIFSNAYGIAIISGAVSGGLEVLDFDSHGNDINAIYNQFIANDTVRFLLSMYHPAI